MNKRPTLVNKDKTTGTSDFLEIEKDELTRFNSANLGLNPLNRNSETLATGNNFTAQHLELTNRQNQSIQSAIETFEEISIEKTSFAKLLSMLETRRDFSQMRSLNRRPSSHSLRSQEQSQSSGQV